MKYSLAGMRVCCKAYSIVVSKEGSIPITNSLAAEYGYDPEKIFEDAERNTPRMHQRVFEILQ